eukprot:g6669.t1
MMADIANIRRRRLERLAITSVPIAAAEVKPAEDAPSSTPKKASKDRSGGTATQAAQDSTIPSEFECILCLRLYHEPVSLPCGHTYCRGCLKRALANKSQCPMCRAACHGGAGDCGTNLAVISIIKSQFPRQYEERQKEAEQDAMVEAETRRRAHTIGESVTPAPDGSVSMPVCLLDMLLFPHQPVTLYLFEPRYITLVNRCLSSTRRFAVFQDRTPATGSCGAILEIRDARLMNRGHYLIMCLGVGRCTSSAEFEVEEGTSGLRYARVSPFEDDDEAITDSAAGGTGIRRRTADEVLGPELRDLADRTAVVVSDCLARLSTRQRVSLVRRCGEPPKVGNTSLNSYRKLSYWLPSALALTAAAPGSGGGSDGGSTSGGGEARERRAAMFRSRSLRQRLSEACQLVMDSEAVRGSTVARRERGLRRLFACGSGAGGGGQGHGFLSSTRNSLILIVGIFAAMVAYQRYAKMRSATSWSWSNLVLALLLLGTSVVRGFVAAPTRISTRSTARAGVVVPRATGADPADKKSGKVQRGLDDVGGQIQTTRDQMRDFIWQATDSIVKAVEDMPDIGRANTTQTLTRLGSILEDFDEKYFSKYLSAGAKPSYQDTLAAATSSKTAKQGVGGKGAAASASKGGGKGDKKEESGAVATASAVSSAVSEAAAGAAKSASSTGDAVAEKVDKAKEKAKEKAEEAVAAASKNLAGSASGTVQLDRPKQVQGVFDDIQAKAVQYYKTSPVTATSKGRAAAGGGGGGGVATPLPEAVQIMEAKLESYLTESRFRPRKLQKDKKSGLVDTISAMEASYPADANPLADPALSGQWSVVYSSSSKLIGRALRGVLAGFFKTSGARQVVDARASSVMNACRARLRMTPLALSVAKKGSYRATGDRKVFVDMPATKKGVLRRLLPSFRSGKVEAEVTYLSNKWRICRANGVTVAFRKTGD